MFIGLAISKDLNNWTDLGKVINHAEDPYLVEDNGTLYIFAEYKKPGNLHFGIGIWQAKSLRKWVFIGFALKSKVSHKLVYDVSSPVVCKDDIGWHMLYELRQMKRKLFGQIYLVNSTSLKRWTCNGILLLGDKPTDDVVPDDNYICQHNICFTSSLS